ncbi:hypothetical protein KC906_04220, partial [Candidatus Kaiserbacteria bacterium]|nr:hypothetical protein [Candidatus Kaiserbacteria bacterium]
MPKKPPKPKPPNNRVTRRMKRVWVTSGGRQVQKVREETRDEARARMRREREKRKQRIHDILTLQECEDECPGDVTVTVTVLDSEPDLPSLLDDTDVDEITDLLTRPTTQLHPGDDYSRDNPLVNERGVRCYPENGMVHMDGCSDGDHILQPRTFMDQLNAVEDIRGPTEHGRQLRLIYRQALAQRHSQRNWTFHPRPTHNNMREIVGENVSIQIFSNTQDVHEA